MRLAILKIPLSSGLQENVEQCITYVTFVPTSWNETVASCLLRGGIPGIYARSWGKTLSVYMDYIIGVTQKQTDGGALP